MDSTIKSLNEQIEGALTAANMAWWTLEFPSGALKFSRNKTDMLGYDAEDFTHFKHFTKLLHPLDHDATMDAMRDHYNGKLETYTCDYRIKCADGSYRTFRDAGKIVERYKDSFTVAGIVTDITDWPS